MLLVPFEWIGIVLALMIIVPLSRRALFFVCDVLSRVMYRFDGRGRRRSLENLHIICGTCRGAEGTKAFNPKKGPYRPTPAEERIILRS